MLPAIHSPADRAREYRHPQHLRLYGRAFPERLRRGCFQVPEDGSAFALDAGEARLQGIVPEAICRAVRQAAEDGRPGSGGGDRVGRIGRALPGRGAAA